MKSNHRKKKLRIWRRNRAKMNLKIKMPKVWKKTKRSKLTVKRVKMKMAMTNRRIAT